MPSEPQHRDRPVVFLNFWGEGGMRHYSESLVHAFGPDRIYYVRNYPSTVAKSGAQLDCDFHPLRPRNWRAISRIAAVLREVEPSALHLNNEQPLLLPLYPRFARLNSVITLHDARSHAGERPAKRLFHSMHLRLVARYIPKVIVHSPAIREALPAWFPRERVHIMPHVNYRLWSAAPPPELPASPITVLFFGRILAYKGLDVLLDAFARLDPAQFRLVIAGEGSLPPVTAPNIEATNRFISDAELPGFFQRTHLVALPYRAASQSGVAQMAFAFGKPVISTRVGALPEIVHDEENGLLVAPGDAAALAGAIRRMADGELRARLAANIARDNRDSDTQIRECLLAIYDA